MIRWAIAMLSSLIPRGYCSYSQVVFCVFMCLSTSFNSWLTLIFWFGRAQRIDQGHQPVCCTAELPRGWKLGHPMVPTIHIPAALRPSGGCPGRQLWSGTCDWADFWMFCERSAWSFLEIWNSTMILQMFIFTFSFDLSWPIGSMYGIYTNIGGILMVNVTIYIAYMDPMGWLICFSCCFPGCPIASRVIHLDWKSRPSILFQMHVRAISLCLERSFT